MSQKKYKSGFSQKPRTGTFLFKQLLFKVAELIFTYPNRTFHIRNMSKETGLSTTATISAINELYELEIITIEETELTTNFKANLDSEKYVFYKRIFNLYQLGEDYNKNFLIRELRRIYSPEAIVLFGSFARGEDIEESDIDLLIISKESGKENSKKGGKETRKEVLIDNLIQSYSKILNRKINLHILPSLEKSSSEFKNAVANGIVLYGYLKMR